MSKVIKILLADPEFKDYKFKSDASKQARRRMRKAIRAKDKTQATADIISILGNSRGRAAAHTEAARKAGKP